MKKGETKKFLSLADEMLFFRQLSCTQNVKGHLGTCFLYGGGAENKINGWMLI
jgi:hypothetical protein